MPPTPDPAPALNPLQVLTVAGSLHSASSTRALIEKVGVALSNRGCVVDRVDLAANPLPLFNPESAFQHPSYPDLKARMNRADVFLLGTPDYHGSMSGVLKNFLDHFWREFAGKLFATIVASHDKGLTVTDQIRTVARQCYAWSLPYGVVFEDKVDVKDGLVISESFGNRLAMLEADIVTYGSLLAEQRRRDLAGLDSGFLARLRR